MKRITVIFLFSLVVIMAWAIFPDEPKSELPADRFYAGTAVPPLWPKPPVKDTIYVPSTTTSLIVKRFTVKYGDTFNDILKSMGLPSQRVNRINRQLYRIFDPAEFKVGIPYHVFYSKEKKEPVRFVYEMDIQRPLEIDLEKGEAAIVEKDVAVEIERIHGVINSSLFESVVKAGAPEDLADKILSIFAWKIDFNNLREGDSFDVLYEQAFVDERLIGSRNVLAATFTHEGSEYRGFAFDNGDGIEYFDQNGQNLSHAPLQFDLITSLYDRKRFHPVRRTYRSHLGMDFEAETGTPVEAPFDGIVLEARYGRANGNFVKIKHTEDLTTQYLHFSKIDSTVAVGKPVKAGQKIGEVGSTGLSSGPHLCLRVWYKGKQRDPLDFDFPRREDVSEENIPAFEEVKNQYLSQLGEPAI